MRGFLFTMGLVIMALTIISLTFTVMQSGQREKTQSTMIAAYDSVRNNVLWIEAGFRDIVEKAGINITVTNYTVSISEALPNANAQNFTQNVDNWKIFAENRSNFHVRLNIQDVKEYLPFALIPLAIRYTHPAGLGGNTIRVESSGGVSNYSIDLDIEISEAITLNWNTLDNNPPNLGFYISVSNSTDTITDQQYIDPDDTSTLSISVPSGTITINVGDPSDNGLLVFSNPNSLNATLTTNMTVSNIKNPRIMFPSEVIQIHSSIINTSQSSSVMIA